MKLIPYKELLTKTKEAVDSALAPLRAKAAKKQAELEIAKLDERIATIESEIQVLTSSKELNFDKIIGKLDDLALVERRRKQFIQIINEMFPE